MSHIHRASAFPELRNLLFRTTPGGRYFDYPQTTDEEIEA